MQNLKDYEVNLWLTQYELMSRITSSVKLKWKYINRLKFHFLMWQVLGEASKNNKLTTSEKPNFGKCWLRWKCSAIVFSEIAFIGTNQETESENTIQVVEQQNKKDVEIVKEVGDPDKAEGLLRFEVNNVSKIKATVLSDPVMIRNLPW